MTPDELMTEACRLAKESVDNNWGGPFGAVGGVDLPRLHRGLIMTYVTMPFYVNRILRSWLTSPGDVPQPATNLKGLAVSGALVVVSAVIFWLVTTQIWHLP